MPRQQDTATESTRGACAIGGANGGFPFGMVDMRRTRVGVGPASCASVGTSVHTDDGRYMVKLCASTSWNEAKNVVTGMFKTDTVGVEDG